MTDDLLMQRHPRLRNGAFKRTSPATPAYNCVAWAAEDELRWWSATDFELYYWPEGVPRQNTVDAWTAALATLGYEPCAGADPEPGVTRIAIYGRDGEAYHVARQLPTGRWTSKLGASVDIEHELEALAGGDYGEVVLIMRRASATESPAMTSVP